MNNKAAFIKLKGDKPSEFKFTQFTAQWHPNMKCMAYGGNMFAGLF